MATSQSSVTYKNPMQKPRIGKVAVNISVGKSGEPLERAMKVLEELTGGKPCQRKAKKTIRNFGISRKEPISCVVTLRGPKASVFLKRALEAVDNRIPSASFDKEGNFTFGIREHIEIPGSRYAPELGIVGMDVCVSFEKLGYRVKRRRIRSSKIGKNQKCSAEELQAFAGEELGVNIAGVE